jgi:hypothetical protein
MEKELYFDLSDEHAGGSLYRVQEAGAIHFDYEHSEYNDDTDEIKVFHTRFADFAAFWQMITENTQWYFLHPLFVHPEQREFVAAQLEGADWSVTGDLKWQHSHQRQWTKVLSDPGKYYRPKT